MGPTHRPLRTRMGSCLLWTFLASIQLLAQTNKIDSIRARLKTEGRTTTRVDLLHELGMTMRDTGEFSTIRSLTEEARTLAIELNYPKGLAISLMFEGDRLHSEKRYPEALAAFKESIALLDAIHEPQGEGSPLLFIRTVYNDMGAQEQRLLFYQEALERYERTGPRLNVGSCHHGIGGYYLISHQFALAVEHYLKAREIFREFEPEFVNNETLVMGWAYQEWGNADRAEPLLREALEGFQREHNKVQTATALMSLGEIELVRGDTLKALAYYRSTLPPNGPNDTNHKAITWSHIIPAYIWTDRPDSARMLLDSLNVLGRISPLPLTSTNGNCEVDYCNYLYGRTVGDAVTADRYLERALEQALAFSALPLVLKYRKELAQRYRLSGAQEKAAEQALAYISMSDSLQAVSNQGAVAAYEGTVKERESALEIQRQQASIRQQRIVLFSAAGGLLLLVALAVSVHRGKKRSDALLLNILPAEVASELKSKGEAEAVQIDQVTVLFTDFSGFTAMSELVTPKQLVKDLHECFSAFDVICEKHNIEKIKTIGDAYMAAGGLPTPNTTHATDVIKAAFEMRDFIAEGKARKIAAGLPFFEIRIGIHTGPVVAGIVGVKKFSYEIWGDTVSTASRMESSGEVGQVNISEATYALVVEQASRLFTFTPRGKVQAKGKGEMEMYFVCRSDMVA